MKNSGMGLGIEAVERGLVPDFVTRRAIRRLCLRRLREVRLGLAGKDPGEGPLMRSMQQGPVAPVPATANEQHYGLPPEFFGWILGARRKYSSCYWPDGVRSLDDAEVAALEVTAARAGIANGQSILELGCGWGSLSIWMAEKYAGSQIVAVSNSPQQRLYIQKTASEKGLTNLRVITADMNQFDPAGERIRHGSFDRVVSVEMFEHMRNYGLLLKRISTWMKPGGKLFLHVFCHRELSYPFETAGAGNWMGQHFFTGGIMPSADLIHRFDSDLRVSEHWNWNGLHYRKTAEAWLARLDASRREVLPVLETVYGRRDAPRWFHRWRMFFLACSELFGHAGGTEWFVSHYLMEHSERKAPGSLSGAGSAPAFDPRQNAARSLPEVH